MQQCFTIALCTMFFGICFTAVCGRNSARSESPRPATARCAHAPVICNAADCCFICRTQTRGGAKTPYLRPSSASPPPQQQQPRRGWRQLQNRKWRVLTSFCTDDGYALRLSPPLANFPGANAAADAKRINEIIGAEVRRDPAQYYWLHRRFKTRPEGEAPRYA